MTDTALGESKDEETGEVVSDYEEINEEKFIWETNDEFKDKCLEIIEKIVLRDVKQTRIQAIEISKQMLVKAMATQNQKVIAVYERVLKEFEEATDLDYEILKKQIFRN